MSSARRRRLIIVALRLIITLLFLPPVLSKVQAPVKWAQQFVAWGYPSWGAWAVTVVEILGLVALWTPSLARVAMAVLAVVLVGAACTWLIHGPSVVSAFPGAIFVFLVCLAWFEATGRRLSR